MADTTTYPAPASDQALLDAVLAAARAKGAPERGIVARVAAAAGVSRQLLHQVREGASSARARPALLELLQNPERLRPAELDAAPAEAGPLSLAAQIRRAVAACGGVPGVMASAQERGVALSERTLADVVRTGRAPRLSVLLAVVEATGAVVEIGPDTDVGAGPLVMSGRPAGPPRDAADGPALLLEQLDRAVNRAGGFRAVERRARELGLVVHQPHLSAIVAGWIQPDPATMRTLAAVTWRVFRLWPVAQLQAGEARSKKTTRRA